MVVRKWIELAGNRKKLVEIAGKCWNGWKWMGTAGNYWYKANVNLIWSYGEMLKYWCCEMLICRNGWLWLEIMEWKKTLNDEILICWKTEIPKCCNVEVLKCWNAEMLKYWNAKILKLWIYELAWNGLKLMTIAGYGLKWLEYAICQFGPWI